MNLVKKHLKELKNLKKLRLVNLSRFNSKHEDLNNKYYKLKQDYYEVESQQQTFMSRVKDTISLCPTCDGLLIKLPGSANVLHTGNCDLADGCVVKIDVIDEKLQERLKEKLQSSVSDGT